MANATTYKDSPVWQQATQLALDTYGFCSSLPAVEKLGLSLQLQQAALRIPSLIAAGMVTRSRAQLLDNCSEALAALAQLETLLIIAGELYPDTNNQPLIAQHDNLSRLLATLNDRLRHPPKRV